MLYELRQLVLNPKISVSLLIVFLLCLLPAFYLIDALYIILALAAVALIVLFSLRPFWGICLVALLYPFIYMELRFGESINIPYADLASLLLFAAWGIRILYQRWYLKERIEWRKVFPFVGVFALFWLAGILSLINAADFWFSLKYLLRPILFFYMMYIVLPLSIIKNKKHLFTILNLMFFLGLVLGLQGLLTMLQNPLNEAIRRARPWSILGIYPLGSNPNLLSEILISTIPIGMMLYYLSAKEKLKSFYLVATAFVVLINFFTFSRAGWLALLVEAALVLILIPKLRLKNLSKYLLIALLLIIPLTAGMYAFSQTDWISNSNANRIFLTQIAWGEFLNYPLFGHGIGSYYNTVGNTYYYILNYGEPLDAHGFIQKTLSETGLFGLLTFLGVLGYIIRVFYDKLNLMAKDNYKIVAAACLALLAGNIVFQLFHPSYYVSKMWLPVGVSFAALLVLLAEERQTDSK